MKLALHVHLDFVPIASIVPQIIMFLALPAQNVLMLIVQHAILVTPLPVWSAIAHISTGLFADLACPIVVVIGIIRWKHEDQIDDKYKQ